MKSKFELKYKFTKKIWKKLHDSNVPIVPKSELDPKKIKVKLEHLNNSLRASHYMPNVSHGFLGINKSNGVTRFIPILSAEDMAVYYYICYLLSDKILEKREGIYGGWHIVPDTQKKTEEGLSLAEIEGYLQDYFSDSISKRSWWKDWTQFVELISDLTSKKEIGNYVLTSDIANFYDSISTDLLLRKIRKKTTEFSEHIDVLEVFLGYWNRRVTGYAPSTKGIPQELFSDASRVLSHFYLQDFDAKFKEICEEQDVTYVRWADDIVLFGSSPKGLEECLHRASKFLLADGLHLSAGKTKLMKKSDYAKLRCVSFLKAVKTNDMKKFDRALKQYKKAFDEGEIRTDTILKTTIGHTAKFEKKASSYAKLFIDTAIRENEELSLTLNDQQIFKAISLNSDPKEMYQLFVKRILKKPYASSRATFLMLLRRRNVELEALGISKNLQRSSIQRIKRASEDSEILNSICIPVTESSF